MGDTKIYSLINDLLSFMMQPLHFVGIFSENMIVQLTKMIQAARSGKQNIIEGSMASGTSKETELKLTNVARASLEELLEDYRDFLRTKQAKEWDKNSKEALFVRQLASGKIQWSEDGTKTTKVTKEENGSSTSRKSLVVTYDTFRPF